MTQEDKAKAYDRVSKEVKDFFEGRQKMYSDVSQTLEYLFPELKESEDERIRKGIKSILEHYKESGEVVCPYPFVSIDEALVWLEKQGDKCLVNFDEAEKEKYDFVSGQYIECRASFNEFKENNSYWLEYIGNDTYIGRSDNILNQKFHITPRQLYRLFSQQHCPKEDNTNEEINAPIEYGKYVDECLNEASKHFFSEGEDKYSVADLFYAGVRCGKSWLEKQGEQKPADKVEPKFKVGDWIVNDYCMGKVIRLTDDAYLLGSGQGIPFSCEHNAHLWSIQDAKEGDVLTWDNSRCIALFKNIYDKDSFNSYGCVGHCTGAFEAGLSYHDIEGAHPATKEQRDLLFQKMNEAGYEWDEENKELKKIEQKSTWSEEDREYTESLLDIGTPSLTPSEVECHKDWLKFLKQRIGGKQ